MKRVVSAALLLLAFSVATNAADSPPDTFFPYLHGDSLQALQDKIALNGGEFTVATNWVYNKTPEEKAVFFSRRPSAFPLLEGRGDDVGPLRNLATPSETYFSWTNYGGQAYIGPVRNQGNCGSCYSFGAAAAAEGTYNVAMNRTGANCVDFSESFIAWCLSTLPAYSSHFSGCDGADYEYAEVLAMTVEGITYETNFPYRETPPASCTYWGAPRVAFSSWHRVPCNDIDAIKTAIRNYGVVDAAVKVTSAFEAYSGGIYSDANTGCSGSPCSYTTTDHAISLVGWNDNGDPVNNGYWILRNSWGSSWGEGGYMRIKYKSAAVACSVVYLVYSNAAPTPPTVSTEPATGITTNRAALNGTVNPQGRATTYWFEYGLTTGYGSQTPALSAGSGSGAVAVSNVLSGLTPGTTYNFRLVATNAGGRANGANRSFTTASAVPVAPVVVTDPATEISDTAANLNGRVTPQGYATGYRFEYGLTTGYGSTTPWVQAGAGSSAVSVQSQITGRTPATLYNFRLVATNAGGTTYGSNRSFTTLATPQAPSVTTLAASPVAWNSATLNGTVNPNGDATTYYFQYGATTAYGSATPGASAGNGSLPVSVNSTLSGLPGSSTWNYRLAAVNSRGTNYGANMVFTTPEEPAPSDVLLSEGFEHGGGMPSGWTMAYLSGSVPWTFVNGDGGRGHPAAAHGGAYNAYMYNASYTARRTQLITPAINFGTRTNQATLTFWHYMEEWCYNGVCDQDELRVYYKTSSGGSWNLLATYNANVAAWTKRILTLPSPNSTYTIAFEGRTVYGYGICVDDVEVSGQAGAPPPPPAVATLDASNLSTTGARLNGTVNPNGLAATHWFEYGTNALYGSSTEKASTGSGSSPVAVSFTVGSLAENELYHFRVVASNSAGISQGNDLTFTTAASGGGTTNLLNEGFEHGGAIPAGWTQVRVSGTTDWRFENGNQTVLGSPASAYAGSYNAVLVDPAFNGGETRLITPAINFGPATNSPTVAFWMYSDAWCSGGSCYTDPLRVYYRTSAGGSWNLLAAYTNGVVQWTQRTLDLPNVNSTYYLAFVGTVNLGNGVCVDEVRVTGQSVASGQPPAALTQSAVSIGATSAGLRGTVNPQGLATQYRFEYGPSPAFGKSTAWASAGSGSVAVEVSAAVQGLLESTTHYFRLLATNSAGPSYGSNLTFQTLAASEVLVSEDFEHGGSLPPGWTLEYVSDTHNWLMANGSPLNHPPAAHGGSYNALFRYTNGLTRLVTPRIDFGPRTNNSTLVFWHFMEEYLKKQDELRIFYRTAEGGPWTLLQTFNTSVGAWVQQAVSLPQPGSNYYLAFQGGGGGGYGVCVDDVSVVGRLIPSRPDFNTPPQVAPGASQFIIQWASEADKAYTVFRSTNLLHGFAPLQTGLVATPFINSYTDSIPASGQRYYMIEETTPP